VLGGVSRVAGAEGSRFSAVVSRNSPEIFSDGKSQGVVWVQVNITLWSYEVSLWQTLSRCLITQ
jgi:hypothetical protein